MPLGWLVSVSLTWTDLSISEEKESQERSCFPENVLRACLGGIFLIVDGGGHAWLTVRGAAPGQVVLGCLVKQAEQGMEREQAEFLQALCFSSCL